jgi:hypothetical protein
MISRGETEDRQREREREREKKKPASVVTSPMTELTCSHLQLNLNLAARSQI